VIPDEIEAKITELKSMEEKVLLNIFSSETGVPKHSKQDYKKLDTITVGKIFDSASVERKQMQYQEDSMSQYKDMVKIESKKKLRKKKRAAAKQS